MADESSLELPSAGRWLVWVSLLGLGGFVWWASWAEIDQITRAPGQVIASSRNQVIQVLDSGVVDEILVKEGSVVKRGQMLLRMERAKLEAAYRETRTKEAALKAAVARLHAEVYGGTPKFESELKHFPEILANHKTLFAKRQSAIKEEIEALQRSLELINAELGINMPLLASGDVSKAEILKLQRQQVEIQGQITNRRNKYMQDAQTELSKSQEELEGVKQILEQRRDMLEHTEIFSPMDGVVRNVRITTRGGVARSGEEIMQIVPVDDDLLVEAKVRPSDIAFVKPGLNATVKLDAYDYTIYGSLNATVTYISADTLNEESRLTADQTFYRVQVKTKGRNFRGLGSEKIEIQPGMTAMVEIKTGTNTVLKYLTKPITKTIAESFGER
ncbi:MAG: HlyD family type I secretion periplasmic adaptor subunit [Magnetococcales bacterium]|nr:HlyD family type I secretion periplasmic adaptor subunit [Magnetococcales bacterium]